MPVTLTYLTTTTPSVQLSRGTASNTTTFFIDNTIFAPFPRPVVGRPVLNPTSENYSTVSNYLVNGIKSFYSEGVNGLGLRRYYSLAVSSSTRATAANFNRILSDLDLIYRHQTSATIANTQTQLSTATQGLVVTAWTAQGPKTFSTLTQFTATHRISTLTLQSALLLLDQLELNRYNILPGNLARDSGGCVTIYDRGRDLRTRAWGSNTTQTISVTYRVQWARPALANSFFNLGSDLVFTPTFNSFGPAVELPAVGTSTQFRTALDTFVNVPLTINGVGGGRGPLWHVSYPDRPYGPPRPVGSTDYFYSVSGGTGVSGDASYLNTLTNSPLIRGTPYQLVGLHYGDYSTKLVIGCRADQTVPLGATDLRVTLSGPQALAGGVYDVSVPGRLNFYTGPTNPSLASTSGWWVYQYDSNTGDYTTSTVSYLDIWTGRKGPDPLGLTSAITSREAHVLTITPRGTGLAQTQADPRGTATNAISLFVNELYIRGLATASNTVNTLWSYNRTHWLSTSQVYTATYTSTVWTGPYLTVTAQRNTSTVGQSNSLTVTVSLTAVNTGSPMTYESNLSSPLYTTSSLTCTNVSPSDNSYDGVGIAPGAAGSGTPPWLQDNFFGYGTESGL